MSVLCQTTSFRIDDVAIGIVDGYLVALLLLAFHVLHISQRQLWDVLIFVQFQQLLDFVLYLVGIYQLVNQLHFD